MGADDLAALLRVLFSTLDLEMLAALRPEAARKLIVLRLIDKIEGQITGGTTQ